jgi:hypothetical protein
LRKTAPPLDRIAGAVLGSDLVDIGMSSGLERSLAEAASSKI